MKRPAIKSPASTRLTRRSVLQAGTLAAAGLSLADVLRLQVAAKGAASASSNDKAVILLWMQGGPSHLDTFDPKPNAPAEFRGEFGAIPTAVPGLQICEHLPRTARVMNQVALVRSLHHRDDVHEGAVHWVTTGYGYPGQFGPVNMRHPRNPSLGSLIARERGPVRPGLPGYIKIFKDGAHEHSYQGAVYLGRQFEPLEIGRNIRQVAFEEAEAFQDRHLQAPTLTLPADMPGRRLQERQALLAHVDSQRSRLESSRVLQDVDVFRRQAFDLLLSNAVREAFDLSREDIRLRERYGRSLWGQGTLLARRLVETGVRMVTVNLLGDAPPPLQNQFNWDTHADHFPAMKNFLLPAFDLLQSALVEDLQQRGLWERVLVVAVGEFGRSPRIFSDGRAGAPGRDHWPQAFSAMLAGGGIRGGQAVGATDRHGTNVLDRPVTPQDLLATIYAHLGIDHHATIPDPVGRLLPILPNGDPIRELL